MDKQTTRILDYMESLYEPSFFERSHDPFYVLIFTVLSQRTRDENTESVTAELFRHYGNPNALAAADLSMIERLIKPSGFYHVKAARIKEISRIIRDRFSGKVPSDLDALLTLPGVGRKTANCTLVYGFRIPAIPVDTHVHRISNRLGLVKTMTPDETEQTLKMVIPKERWLRINEFMVKFGQNKCYPVRPSCSTCDLTDLCTYFAVKKGTNAIR